MLKTIGAVAVFATGCVLVGLNHVPLGVTIMVSGSYLTGLATQAAEVTLLRRENRHLAGQLEFMNRNSEIALKSLRVLQGFDYGVKPTNKG